METDALGSSNCEQGSTWAMEVGGHLKVHSILVENLNKNGQMLVEVCAQQKVQLSYSTQSYCKLLLEQRKARESFSYEKLGMKQGMLAGKALEFL